ncbi:hypothetical protein MRX96_008634 [Rhipicephalus microplus]
MATPNQVTGYDPESIQIIQMDTAQTETPLPTKEEYLKDMLRVWRGRKNTAVASRDARAPAVKQQAASRPQQAQGKNAPTGQVGIPRGSKPRKTGEGRNKRAPTPKTGPKEAPAAKSNKPEPKKTNTGHSTNVKYGTPSEPPVLVKNFPPLTPVQAQVSCWSGAVSGPSSSPSPTETALQQQIGELRRQNQILARKIQELEAKQVGSSEPVQEAEAEDGDDGSSVTSRLSSVSRQDADKVVEPASITRSIGHIESLERKTEQLEASVAALPTQIMSAVREFFQDMFTAALTQALPEIVAQVSNSVLKAVQPWVIAQTKNTTQSDSPQVKRKLASRQAAEEGFSGPAPGPDRSSAP